MNWLQQLVSRKDESSNVSEEIAEHLREKAEELMAGGMPHEEAMFKARREIGNVVLIEERSREVWQWSTVEAILRDTRYALRQLRRNPGFTFTVLLTLSVAIGANTAVFSMIDALLLRPLPYPQPERVGLLQTRYSGVATDGTTIDGGNTGADGETWQLVHDNVPAVVSGATAGVGGVNLQVGSSIRYVNEQRVTARYLEALGIPPVFGRSFTEEEDKPNGPKVAVLSAELCRSVFGHGPDAIGKSILLKGEPYTVVGVLPDNAKTVDKVDVWTPLRPTTSGEGEGDNYDVIFRLRDGASWAQTDAQLAQLRPALLTRFEKQEPRGHSWFYAMPLQRSFAQQRIEPVYILMSAVAFILLIAGANLAALMLVRVTRRQGEIATRLALGATPASVLRQLMLEPLLLAIGGGLIGVLIATAGLKALTQLVPAYMIPVGGLAIDSRVLLFAAGISLFCTLLIGLLPALELRRMDLRTAMTTISSRSVSLGSRPRTRQLLIAGEVTLTVVLLAGAGLLIRTLVYLQTLPPGFDGRNVMTAQLSLDDARYHNVPAFQKLLQQSVDAMKRIPGVESAAVGLSLPFERGLNDGFGMAEGPDAGKSFVTNAVYVTPEYFQVLRIPVLAGRPFTATDTATSEPVVVVNTAFAKKFFHTTDVIGHHIRLGKAAAVIVGVVGDVTKKPGLSPTAPLSTEETYYFPATQVASAYLGLIHIWLQPSWIVRTDGPIYGLPEAMQKALAEADPSLPFAGFQSLKELQDEALQQQRFEVLLLGTLAALALLLSLIGVYGLVSNMVAQRTREIGIRMALGSTVNEAMVEIGKSGMAAVACGLAAGLALAAMVTRLIASELYGVKTHDPLTFGAAVVLLALTALVAAFAPTMRIARIDPALTLRSE